MPSRREKINAAVDTAVRYSPLAGNIQLLSQVFLILLIHVGDNGLPAGGEGAAAHGQQVIDLIGLTSHSTTY